MMVISNTSIVFKTPNYCGWTCWKNRVTRSFRSCPQETYILDGKLYPVQNCWVDNVPGRAVNDLVVFENMTKPDFELAIQGYEPCPSAYYPDALSAPGSYYGAAYSAVGANNDTNLTSYLRFEHSIPMNDVLRTCWLSSNENSTLYFYGAWDCNLDRKDDHCVCDNVCHLPRFNDCCLRKPPSPGKTVADAYGGSCWPKEPLTGCGWQAQVKQKLRKCTRVRDDPSPVDHMVSQRIDPEPCWEIDPADSEEIVLQNIKMYDVEDYPRDKFSCPATRSVQTVSGRLTVAPNTFKALWQKYSTFTSNGQVDFDNDICNYKSRDNSKQSHFAQDIVRKAISVGYNKYLEAFFDAYNSTTDSWALTASQVHNVSVDCRGSVSSQYGTWENHEPHGVHIDIFYDIDISFDRVVELVRQLNSSERITEHRRLDLGLPPMSVGPIEEKVFQTSGHWYNLSNSSGLTNYTGDINSFVNTSGLKPTHIFRSVPGTH
jgi:hypothetical protein